MEHPFGAQHTSRTGCPAQGRLLLPAQGPELALRAAVITVHEPRAQYR